MIGNSFQAVECFRKAIFLEPLNYNILYNASLFFLHIEHYSEAFELIRQSIEAIKPKKVPYEYHLTLTSILDTYGIDSDNHFNLEYSFEEDNVLASQQERPSEPKERIFKMAEIALIIISLALVILISIRIVYNRKYSNENITSIIETASFTESDTGTNNIEDMSSSGSSIDTQELDVNLDYNEFKYTKKTPRNSSSSDVDSCTNGATLNKRKYNSNVFAPQVKNIKQKHHY